MNDLFEGPTVHGEPETPEPSRAQKREQRAKRKRAAKRRRRAIVAVIIALAVVGTGGYFLVTTGSTFLADLDIFGGDEPAADYPGPGSGSVDVTVAAGATGAAIGDELVTNGVVASREAFIAAYSVNPEAPSIQPGTYTLTQQIPASVAVTALLDHSNRVDALVDVRPGYRVDDIVAKLTEMTGIPEEEFRTAMEDRAATGLPADVPNYDGWLAPKQYQFGPDTTASEMIAAMVAQTTANLDTLEIPAADRAAFLTKASIVQAEAGSLSVEDRALVASVIDNRITAGAAGPTGGRLEMDSTIHYMFGEGAADASTTPEQRATPGPYNTYLNTGLPVGPIAAPSLETLQATKAPAASPYFFFVTVDPDTGETRFAETYAEHQANAQLYNEWVAEHRKG